MGTARDGDGLALTDKLLRPLVDSVPEFVILFPGDRDLKCKIKFYMSTETDIQICTLMGTHSALILTLHKHISETVSDIKGTMSEFHTCRNNLFGNVFLQTVEVGFNLSGSI